MSEWLKPESPVSEKILLPIIRNSRLKERNLLDYGYVEEVIRAHGQGVEENFRLWNLITLSLWYDYWFK
jgi:hypothetical protein